MDGAWIVIAAYQEETTIGRVVGDVVAAGWPVVVVDDGSRDSTSREARRSGARVVRHVVNRGQGAALQTGIDYALACGAKAIVTFDADGQHRVEDVAALLAALGEGADVALGSRFLGEMVGASVGRRLLLRLSVVLSNALSGLPLTDAHCGLRAFRASAADSLRIRQDRMAHASELLRNIRRSGLRCVEVPVTVRYSAYSRAKGQSALGGLRILFDYFLR